VSQKAKTKKKTLLLNQALLALKATEGGDRGEISQKKGGKKERSSNVQQKKVGQWKNQLMRVRYCCASSKGATGLRGFEEGGKLKKGGRVKCMATGKKNPQGRKKSYQKVQGKINACKRRVKGFNGKRGNNITGKGKEKKKGPRKRGQRKRSFIRNRATLPDQIQRDGTRGKGERKDASRKDKAETVRWGCSRQQPCSSELDREEGEKRKVK